MIKKNKLYLIAITVLALASLFILSVSCSPETGDNAGNGTEPSDVTNDSSEPADTPTSEEKLVFLSKRGYISEIGCPTIVGEVTNAGNFSMKDILITASFYCSKGKLIGAKEGASAHIPGYTEIEILAPGETSPFKIGLSREQLSQLPNFDVNKVEKYKVVGDYDTTDEELYKSFEISQSTGEFNNATGHYGVVGKVKNIGNETAEQVKVVGTFYDSQTRIIEVVHTYLQNPLLPGDEAQFEFTVLDETIAQRIETYYIQAVEYEKSI